MADPQKLTLVVSTHLIAEALLVPPGAEQMVNLTTKQGIKKADEEHL